MGFGKFFKSKEDKAYRIMIDFIGNAFHSVKDQMNLEPLCKTKYSSINKARCRLCLYSMNSGILSWLIVSRMGAQGKEYVHDFHKLLTDVIIVKDPEIVNKIEDLVLDKAVLENIKTKISNIITNRLDSRSFKNVLFGGYLLNRIMAYHNAVDENISTMVNANPLNPDSFPDQVTKVFVRDFFGTDYMSNYEFSVEFTLNISMNSFMIFSEEVERILD